MGDTKTLQPLGVPNNLGQGDLMADPAVVKAFMVANQAHMADTGKPILVNSAYRSIQEQAALYQQRDGKSPVAAPGKSGHNYGASLDIQNWESAKPYLEAVGFSHPNYKGDPYHFDFKGATPMAQVAASSAPGEVGKNFNLPPVNTAPQNFQLGNPLIDYNNPQPIDANLPAPAIDPAVAAQMAPINQGITQVNQQIGQLPVPSGPAATPIPTPQQANQQAAAISQNLQAVPPQPTKPPSIFDGVGNFLKPAWAAVSNGLGALAQNAGHAVMQQVQHPMDITNPADLVLRNPFTQVGLGAADETANLVNGILKLPSDIGNAMGGHYAPLLQLPTGGLHQLTESDPVYSSIGRTAPYAVGEAGAAKLIGMSAKGAELLKALEANKLLSTLAGAGVNAGEMALTDPGDQGLQGRLQNAAMGFGLGATLHGGGLALDNVLKGISTRVEQAADAGRYQQWLQDHEPLNNLQPTDQPVHVGADPMQLKAPSQSPRYGIIQPEQVQYPGGVPKSFPDRYAAGVEFRAIQEADPNFKGRILQTPDGRWVVHDLNGTPSPEVAAPEAAPQAVPGTEATVEQPATPQPEPQPQGPRLGSDGYYDPASLNQPTEVAGTTFNNQLAAKRAIKTLVKDSPDLADKLEYYQTGKGKWSLHLNEEPITDAGAHIPEQGQHLSTPTEPVAHTMPEELPHGSPKNTGQHLLPTEDKHGAPVDTTSELQHPDVSAGTADRAGVPDEHPAAGIETRTTPEQDALINEGKATTTEQIQGGAKATQEKLDQAFNKGKAITTEGGAEVFAGKTPDKTQAAITDAQKADELGKKRLVGYQEGRQLVQEYLPDKLPFYDAFWHAGAEGKQLIVNYRERVRGYAKGSVDETLGRLASGKPVNNGDFTTKEAAQVAAEAHKRLNPTHQVSEPYPVTTTYTTPKKGIEKTKTIWRVDSIGDRQIDPFGIGVQMKDGEPHMYAMSYNYGSTKAGNIRGYKFGRMNESVGSFETSKIDEASPYKNSIQAIQRRADEARQMLVDTLPTKRALEIMNHVDSGNFKAAANVLRKELRKIEDPATLETIEQSFNIWCAHR